MDGWLARRLVERCFWLGWSIGWLLLLSLALPWLLLLRKVVVVAVVAAVGAAVSVAAHEGDSACDGGMVRVGMRVEGMGAGWGGGGESGHGK